MSKEEKDKKVSTAMTAGEYHAVRNAEAEAIRRSQFETEAQRQKRLYQEENRLRRQ